MSASVGYLPQAQPPNAVLTLSATSGTAPLSLYRLHRKLDLA